MGLFARQRAPRAWDFRSFSSTDPLHPVPGKPGANVAAPDAQQPPPQPVTRANVWFHRVSMGIFVLFCVELGMLLVVLPWTKLWAENNLLSSYSLWRTVARDNFIRGAISGIGVIDVWLGIWEAVHYRDPGKPRK